VGSRTAGCLQATFREATRGVTLTEPMNATTERDETMTRIRRAWRYIVDRPLV
jgi:hypothetical protein